MLNPQPSNKYFFYPPTINFLLNFYPQTASLFFSQSLKQKQVINFYPNYIIISLFIYYKLI